MSELRADTITASDGTSPVTLTKQSAAKAWLNYFHQTETVGDSFGISTMTDVSTGIATANWSNNFNSANYVPLVMGEADPASHYTSGCTRATNSGANAVFTTSAHQYLMHNIGGTVIDAYYTTAQYCGDLA